MTGLLVIGLILASPSANDVTQQRIVDGLMVLIVSVDKPESLVAEPIRLRLTIEGPAGCQIRFPTWEDDSDGFTATTVQSIQQIPLGDPSGRNQWSIELELQSLHAAKLKIPALEVLYRLPDADDDSNSLMRSLQSKPISITIHSLIETDDDPTKFRDIKEPEAVSTVEPGGGNTWTPVAATLGLVLASIALVLWRRFRGKQDSRKWMLAEIDRLELQFANDSSQADDQLSLLVREFLLSEWGLNATAQTTEQLLDAMRNRLVGERLVRRTQRLLVQADRSRFSGVIRADSNPAEDMFDLARSIIGDPWDEPATNGNQ